MKNLTLILFAAILIFSCGTSSENSTNSDSAPEEISLDSLKSQVLAIHDEVMPKIGKLRKTRIELETLADSLMAVDSTRAAIFTSLASDIAGASEGMMQWMRSFEPDFEGTDEEIKQYLENQRVAVQKVKEDMNSSLAKGEEALGN